MRLKLFEIPIDSLRIAVLNSAVIDNSNILLKESGEADKGWDLRA